MGRTAELDINDVIRENFKFLQEQMYYDTCETELRKEYGENWPTHFGGKTLQQIAREDSKFALKFETVIGEIERVPGWHFQTQDFELPTPTVDWIADQTGLKKNTIEGLNNGQRFLVEELIAIAAVFNTSIQALLMPTAGILTANTELAFKSKTECKKIEVSSGRWFLWLHNLKSLPGQHFYLFERHNSYIGLSGKKLHGNTKLFPDDVKKQLANSRYGDFSKYEDIENYKRIPPGLGVDVLGPYEGTETETQIWTIRTTLGLFVELRKLFREETVKGPGPRLNTRRTTGLSKIRNYIIRIMRVLRNS